MRDRFMAGFWAGIIAAFVTNPIATAAKYLNLVEVQLIDFAGLLSLGRLLRGMTETVFSAYVDLFVSAALGII